MRADKPEAGILYEAQLHWIVLTPPVAIFIGGLVAIAFNTLAAIAMLLVSIGALFVAYWQLVTTRILVTERRVIYRTGAFGRRTMEMNKDKIESIDVSQSILGRILEFGSVTVKGTGGGMEAIHNVSSPFALRDHVASNGTEPSWLPGISEPTSAAP